MFVLSWMGLSCEMYLFMSRKDRKCWKCWKFDIVTLGFTWLGIVALEGYVYDLRP